MWVAHFDDLVCAFDWFRIINLSEISSHVQLGKEKAIYNNCCICSFCNTINLITSHFAAVISGWEPHNFVVCRKRCNRIPPLCSPLSLWIKDIKRFKWLRAWAVKWQLLSSSFLWHCFLCFTERSDSLHVAFDSG